MTLDDLERPFRTVAKCIRFRSHHENLNKDITHIISGKDVAQ